MASGELGVLLGGRTGDSFGEQTGGQSQQSVDLRSLAPSEPRPPPLCPSRVQGGEGGGSGPEQGLTPPGSPRYDVLFMPPSFPFGGMENPCLTFVTPCLLAGDRSLADVIIHEISHSWFGNLVTNANWSEFWLNEGFTMYAQRRISACLFGERPRGPPGRGGVTTWAAGSAWRKAGRRWCREGTSE